MNKPNYLLTVLALIPVLVACSDKEEGETPLPPSPDTSIKGIFAYAEHPERKRDTLDVSFSDLRDALIFTTRALPMGSDEVDLTKVHLSVEVDKEARVEFSAASDAATIGPGKSAPENSSVENTVNLTLPGQRLSVIAGNGDRVSYSLQTVVTPPYEVVPEYETTLTEMWTKTGTELGLVFPRSCRSMCVAGDYLLILDNTIDYSADAKIKVYDKLTGEFVKNVPIYEGGWAGPRSYTWTLAADEAGHFAMGRLNSGGAGFWMDVYENIDAMPTNPFKLAGNQVPENAGKRMQILGDLYSGSAYVCLTSSHFYGDVPMQGQYATWTMTNGTPGSVEPNVLSYPASWHSAVVERASLDDPTMYVTYNDETGYPNDPFENWDKLHAAHFVVYNPGSGEAPLEMDQQNFKYRILDSKVFRVKDARYLFTLQQGYSTGTGEMATLLYNISSKTAFSKTPASPVYDRYRLYESPGYVSANDLRYGSVTVAVDETTSTAYMYAFYPASEGKEARVTALKMELGEEIE